MTYIHPTAIIHPGVQIGKDCYIGPYCIIGAEAQIIKGFGGNPTGKVVIGDRVVLKGHCTVDSGTFRPTVIDSGCFLMYYAHVGYDPGKDNGGNECSCNQGRGEGYAAGSDMGQGAGQADRP